MSKIGDDSNGTLVDYDAGVKLDHGDKFVYSRGVYMRVVGKRRIRTRIWDLSVYRYGVKTYDIRIMNGGVCLRIRRLYARLDPIIIYILMIIRNNRGNNACNKIASKYEWCDADECNYALGKYIIFAEYNNTRGLFKYTDPVTKKRKSLVINIDSAYIPLLAEMVMKRNVQLANLKPKSKLKSSSVVGVTPTPVPSTGTILGPWTRQSRLQEPSKSIAVCKCGCGNIMLNHTPAKYSEPNSGYQSRETMDKLKEISGIILEHSDRMKKIGVSERETFDPKYFNGAAKDKITSKLSELSQSIKKTK
ncbi:Hypothetical protein FSTVST1_426 [Faustovirus ST1]|nr:Hypothetical protein FSTVST1_426 [Faustovirus ST1]